MEPKKKRSKKGTSIVRYTQEIAAFIHTRDHKKTIVPRSPTYFQHQVNKFQNEEEITLVIHNQKPKRTLAQNAFYWGAYLPMIAEETGERDIDRLHNLFKAKFLTIGIYEVLGEKVRITKSTSELSIQEFSDYITAIYNLTNVEPPPTVDYGLQFMAFTIKETQTTQ